MSDDAPAPGARDRTGDGTPPAGSSAPEVWPAPADGGAPHVAPQDGSLVDARTTDTGRAAADTRDAGTPASDPWALPGDRAPASGGPGGTVVAGGTSPWPAPTVHDRTASGTSSVHAQETVTSFPTASNPAPPAPASTPGPYGSPWTGPSAAAAAAPVPQAADPFASPVAGAAVPPPPIGPEGPGQLPYGYPHAGYAGAPAQGHPGWTGMPPLPSNGMGVSSLVLGIIAAAGFCFWPVAIALGVLAVIFGAIGRGKASRGEATNAGQALAGIICGAVGSALALILGVVVLVT